MCMQVNADTTASAIRSSATSAETAAAAVAAASLPRTSVSHTSTLAASQPMDSHDEIMMTEQQAKVCFTHLHAK